MFNSMMPSDLSCSSPLKSPQDVNFSWDVIMKHWFNFFSQEANERSTYECNKLS